MESTQNIHASSPGGAAWYGARGGAKPDYPTHARRGGVKVAIDGAVKGLPKAAVSFGVMTMLIFTAINLAVGTMISTGPNVFWGLGVTNWLIIHRGSHSVSFEGFQSHSLLGEMFVAFLVTYVLFVALHGSWNKSRRQKASPDSTSGGT